jgi:hypothetical protein
MEEFASAFDAARCVSTPLVAVCTADPGSTTHFIIETLKQGREPPPLLLWKRQGHSPPWNRPNAWASISDMIRIPAPRTSTCWVLRRLKLPTRQTSR